MYPHAYEGARTHTHTCTIREVGTHTRPHVYYQGGTYAHTRVLRVLSARMLTPLQCRPTCTTVDHYSTSVLYCSVMIDCLYVKYGRTDGGGGQQARACQGTSALVLPLILREFCNYQSAIQARVEVALSTPTCQIRLWPSVLDRYPVPRRGVEASNLSRVLGCFPRSCSITLPGPVHRYR